MRALVVPLLAAAVFAACASAEPVQQAQLRLRLVAQGLASPTYVAAAPGEPGALYVVEQSGRIHVLVGGRLRATRSSTSVAA